MMQVLIVTHANMAAGIVSSVDLIMGPQEGLYSIGLAADDSFESFNEKVRNKLAEIVCDDGVLVFVDLYGGTPCNVTAANINRSAEQIYYTSGKGFAAGEIRECASSCRI